MEQSKRYFYLWGMNLFLLLVSFNPILITNATKPKSQPSPFSIKTIPPDDSVSVGQTIYLPVIIEKSPKWKTVEISFEVNRPFSAGNPSDIKIEKVKINSNQQAPQKILVPIRLTKEGLFWLQGSILIDLEATNSAVKNVPTSVKISTSASVFAFENKVFLGTVGTSDGYEAIHKMAAENLRIKSIQYRAYLKNNPYQALVIRTNEQKRLTQAFFKHNPTIKKEKNLQHLWDANYKFTPPYSIRTVPPDHSVAIGKTIYLPVIIEKSPKWKSIEVSFNVDQPFSAGNPSNIKIGTVKLNANQQAPHKVLVPIQVMGEGLFWLDGTIKINLYDQNLQTDSVQSKLSFNGASAFAFENKVFLGTVGSSNGYEAIHKMAAENLLKKSSQYRANLKNNSHQAFRLKLIEQKRLIQAFFDQNPSIRKGSALRMDWDDDKFTVP